MWFIVRLFICIPFLCSLPIMAMDLIRFEKGQSELDIRGNYKQEALRLALDHTIENYGPYKITTDAPRMNALQARNQKQVNYSMFSLP